MDIEKVEKWFQDKLPTNPGPIQDWAFFCMTSSDLLPGLIAAAKRAAELEAENARLKQALDECTVIENLFLVEPCDLDMRDELMCKIREELK